MRKWDFRVARMQAQERKKALLERFFARRQSIPSDSNVIEPSSIPAAEKAPASPSPNPLSATLGPAGVAAYNRDEQSIPLWPEPWLKALGNLLLRASSTGGNHIALMWPGRIDSLAVAHALAAMERLAIRDLYGLRTILYPVKQTSFNRFNHLLFDRPRLCELIEALWTAKDYRTTLNVLREDKHVAAYLSALLTINRKHSDTPYPTIGEILPWFIFDPIEKQWGDYQHRLLCRSITKLPLAHRRTIRNDAFPYVGSPITAPNAMFGIPYGTKKEEWKAAWSAQPFGKGNRRPELLLVDATNEMAEADRRLVRRIPDYVALANGVFSNEVGVVIVTDSPATYFTLKKAMVDKLHIGIDTHVIVSESSGTWLSANPHSDTYVPPQRSLRHFRFEILDREAAGVSSKLLGLAKGLSNNQDAAKACYDAALYVLQVSHVPAGYQDLGQWLEEDDRNQFEATRLSWANYQARIAHMIHDGSLGAQTREVELALDRATKLVTESWYAATPIALRLARELADLPAHPHDKILVALVRADDIEIAKHFLKRFFETTTPFESFETQVTFITHRELSRLGPELGQYKRVFLVRLTDRLIRLLTTSEEIPAGATILLSYAQAVTSKKALLALKTITALKPFKGRISGMAEELDRQLKQIPNPLSVTRLPQHNLSLDVQGARNDIHRGTHDSWRFELEGIGSYYVNKRIFQYRPDNDPPFAITAAEDIHPGDSVFVMSDDLRDLVENTLAAAGFSSFQRGHRFAGMLQLYHNEVRRRSKELFPARTKRERAQKIKQRMAELDSQTNDCAITRILHWLDLDDDEPHSRPQASRDRVHYEAFVRALEIPEVLYKDFWVLAINTTRRESRSAGRELSDFYTNVIFHPESLQVYHNVSADALSRMLRRATDDVHRVISITPPANSGLIESGHEE